MSKINEAVDRATMKLCMMNIADKKTVTSIELYDAINAMREPEKNYVVCKEYKLPIYTQEEAEEKLKPLIEATKTTDGRKIWEWVNFHNDAVRQTLKNFGVEL